MIYNAIKTKFFSHPYYLLKRHVFNQLNFTDYKKIFHYFKIIIKNKLLGYPRLAIIETGTTCNLQCPTCPTPRSALNRPLTLMRMDNFRKIVDHLEDAVHVVLLYNSNEPLLHPCLPDMIKYACGKNLYTMISTNVTLLDKKKTDEILDSGLDEILLCLDGMSQSTYEPFRQGAKYDQVVENIKYFCAEKRRRGLLKPFVELQFIITKLNQHEIPLIKKFAQEIGVDRLRKKSLSIGQYAYPEPSRTELADKYLPISLNAKNKYIIGKDGKIDQKNRLVHCNAVDNQVVILVDGRWSMCCYDIKGEYIIGDILNYNFKDVWKDKDVVDKLKKARNRGYALCHKCEIF